MQFSLRQLFSSITCLSVVFAAFRYYYLMSLFTMTSCWWIVGHYSFWLCFLLSGVMFFKKFDALDPLKDLNPKYNASLWMFHAQDTHPNFFISQLRIIGRTGMMCLMLGSMPALLIPFMAVSAFIKHYWS